MPTIIITGRVGRDPQLRYTPNGTPVANFSVADNRRWKDGDGNVRDETIWFQVSTFGRLAEVCAEHLTKGRLVAVRGRLRPDEEGNPRIWRGSDNLVRASFEVTADAVEFLGGRGEARTEEPEDQEEIPFAEEEEIPF